MKRLALGVGFCTLTAMAGEYQSFRVVQIKPLAPASAASGNAS